MPLTPLRPPQTNLFYVQVEHVNSIQEVQAAPTQSIRTLTYEMPPIPRVVATGPHTVARSAFINLRQPHFQPSRTSSFASCSRARPRLNTRRFWVKGSILLSRRVHTIPYAHDPAYAHATLAHPHKVHPARLFLRSGGGSGACL